MQHDLPPDVIGLIGQIQELLQENCQNRAEVGRLIAQLRSILKHGQCAEVYRDLFPNLRDGSIRRKVNRYLKSYEKQRKSQETSEVLQFSNNGAKAALPTQELEDYYAELARIDKAPHGSRCEYLQEVARRHGISRKTVERDLRLMRENGWNKSLLVDERGKHRRGDGKLPAPLPELWHIMRITPNSKKSLCAMTNVHVRD